MTLSNASTTLEPTMNQLPSKQKWTTHCRTCRCRCFPNYYSWGGAAVHFNNAAGSWCAKTTEVRYQKLTQVSSIVVWYFYTFKAVTNAVMNVQFLWIVDNHTQNTYSYNLVAAVVRERCPQGMTFSDELWTLFPFLGQTFHVIRTNHK